MGLGQGVEFRFLGAQEGALRALGVCDPRARLPWLVRSRSGDQDHYDDAALREWAARQYSTTTTAALRIPEESPRHRPRAVDTLASAFALGKSLGRKDVHVATISNTTKATTTLEAASSPHQIGGDVKNDLRSGDLGGSFRGDDDNGGRRGRRSRIIEVQQWNFFHLPKCAGTALIGALEREAKAHGIKTCNGHSQVRLRVLLFMLEHARFILGPLLLLLLFSTQDSLFTHAKNKTFKLKLRLRLITTTSNLVIQCFE